VYPPSGQTTNSALAFVCVFRRGQFTGTIGPTGQSADTFDAYRGTTEFGDDSHETLELLQHFERHPANSMGGLKLIQKMIRHVFRGISRLVKRMVGSSVDCPYSIRWRRALFES